MEDNDAVSEIDDFNGLVTTLVELCRRYNKKEYILIIFDCLFYPRYYNHSWLYTGDLYL